MWKHLKIDGRVETERAGERGERWCGLKSASEGEEMLMSKAVGLHCPGSHKREKERFQYPAVKAN